MDKSRAVDALQKLGLNPLQIELFFDRTSVIYSLRTESDPGIAVIEWKGVRLRSGIIEIKDVGGGVKDFIRFRTQSRNIAVTVGVAELELFGGAIINEKLEALLLRKKFARSITPVPDELGGGTMEILTRLYAID